MVTGLETLAVGYLTAWAVRKARHVSERADGTVDQLLDHAMDRLDSVVLGKVGHDPAIERLELAAVAGPVAPEISRDAAHVIADALHSDAAFLAQLQAVLNEIHTASTAAGQVVINAAASGQAKMPVLGSGTQHNSFA